MKTLLIALVSIAASVTAQFSLKAGMAGESVQRTLSQPLSFATLLSVLMEKHILGGFALYGLGAIVWLNVLSKWDVSKAYPLVGLGFVVTLVVGFLLGEAVTIERVFGVILICSGVTLLAGS